MTETNVHGIPVNRIPKDGVEAAIYQDGSPVVWGSRSPLVFCFEVLTGERTIEARAAYLSWLNSFWGFDLTKPVTVKTFEATGEIETEQSGDIKIENSDDSPTEAC